MNELIDDYRHSPPFTKSMFQKVRCKSQLTIHMANYVGYSEINIRWAVKKNVKEGKIFYYIQNLAT